jgi:hypothetical protein
MRYAPGTRVTVDDPKYPGVWIVQSSHGPKNTTVIPEGGGRGLRAPHFMIREFTGETPPPAPDAKPYRGFVLGEFVTVRGQTGTYVVIADKGEKVNVALAGGNDNRYLRAPRSWVEPVSVSVSIVNTVSA